jgi:GNAT superfamily N-acetyltransferase
MDIKAFREQYPQYNSLSDQDLADSLHQKYYSDIPKDQFLTNFGVAPAQPQQPREPGWGEAFALGIDQPLENMAKTAKLGGFDRTASALSGAMIAPQNVESPSARFINPRPEDWQVFGYGVGSMPKAIVEQAGQIGGSILSRGAGAAVGGAAGSVVGPVTGAVGAGVGALAGPFVFEAVQIVGPVAYERAKNNGREKPNEEDINYALGTAAASGAFNAIGTKFLPGGGDAVKSVVKRYLMAGVGEGVTETGQAFVQQAGETLNTQKGLTLNPREAIGEGLLGAGAGTASQGVASAASTAKETIQNLKDDVTTPLDEDAAKRVAARINLYEAQGYDLMDVDPTSDKGAKQVLTGINMDLGNEIKQLHEKVKPLLAPSADSELQDIFDRAALITGVRKGVNRLKSGMTDENIAKVQELVGSTEEGFALVEKLKEAREIGRMYQKGVKGGLSRFTDTISPISTEQGMMSPTNAMRLAATYAGGTATGGVMPILQTGAFLAGRAVDKLTGNRSRVAKYARVNSDPNVLTPQLQMPQGLRSLTGEQEQARRQAEAQRAAQAAVRAEAARLRVEQEQRRRETRETGLRLLKDDIVNDRVPGGGFLRSIYDTHGLKPSQITIGLNSLRNDGVIDAATMEAFLLDSNQLMEGNTGNRILDRLVRMADAGKISRDPDWKPQQAQAAPQATPGQPQQAAPQPTMTSATRQAPMDERRRIAYEQQARANQERVSNTIMAIQSDARIPEAIKPRLLEAAALIGKTNNKQEAQAVADGVDKALSFDTGLKMIAQSYLQPLVDQIRHKIDPNGPKPQAMRRSEAKITKARTEALIEATTQLADQITTAREALAKAQSRPDATQSSTVEISGDGAISRNGQTIGRVKIDDVGSAIRIADIEVKSSERNAGVGSDVIRQIQRQAQERGVPVVLTTDAMRGGQDAQRRLYERLGFVENAGDNAVAYKSGNRQIREEMVWRPDGSKASGFDLNTLTPSERGRSAIEILRGPDAPKGSRTVTEVAKALQERARADGLGKWTTANRTPEIDEALARIIAAEVVEELGNSRNASDWYSREMQKALNAAALIHPELQSDPIARMVFNLALAITSQGVVVSDNANYAMRWYEAYKASVPKGSNDFRGKFPLEGWGKSAPSIIANAKKVNDLIEKYGPQDVLDLMSTQFTVKELNDVGYDIGGENMGSLVWGSAILGPKIGNGFYQNLAGNFSPVTIDMWLMRLWGRITGNSIGIEEEAQRKQEDRLRKSMQDDGSYDEAVHANSEGLFDAAEDIMRQWERDFRKYGKKGLDEGIINKTEKIKAAERLLFGRDAPIDAPSSAAVRNWIRDVINIAQAKLQAQGINVTNADLQAIIWYPEKRLWTRKMGSREKGSGEDGAQSAGETSYMHEFARIARERGYSDAEVQKAIQSPTGAGSGTGSIQPTARPVYGESGQVDGPDEAQTRRKEELLTGALAVNKGMTLEAAQAARQAALAKAALSKAPKPKGSKKKPQDTE